MKESGRVEYNIWRKAQAKKHERLHAAMASTPTTKTWDPGDSIRHSLHLYEAHYAVLESLQPKARYHKVRRPNP